MDLNKLKNRPPFPIETIAVAVTFSPQCGYLLGEANKLASLIGSTLLIIHVGDKSPEKENIMDEMLKIAGINDKVTRVIWMDGDVVETILKLCKLNIVDLLILGALQKENIFKFYIGSIARTICRRAKCSVLLLSNPTQGIHSIRKVAVNGVLNPKTAYTINTVFYLSKYLPVKQVDIVNEIDLPTLAMTIINDSNTEPESKIIKQQLEGDVEKMLRKVLEKSDNINIEVKQHSIKGKPGYAISKYARDEKVDLLAINSPDTNLNLLDRIFTHDIEYILADLPCNLLIVHSRVKSS